MKRISAILMLFFCSLLLPKSSFAVSNAYFSPATYLPIGDKDVQEGSIISYAPQSYILSKVPYDQFVVGVVTNSPAISEDIKGPVPSYPILTSGQGFILVSTVNGFIRKGDMLTSSNIPGVAMKASKSGYIVGGALQDYTVKDPKIIGKIPVNLHIRYFSSSGDASILGAETARNTLLKYIFVGSIDAMALFFAFIVITRTASKGIDALGRNPLSSLDIHIGMIFNISTAIVILVCGFIMSVVILRFQNF